MLGKYLGKDILVIIHKSNDNRQVEWKTLKLGHYMKFSKFHYVSSMLSPTFKKEWNDQEPREENNLPWIQEN